MGRVYGEIEPLFVKLLPIKVFPRLAVNKTILKPRLVAATGSQYQYYTLDFPDIYRHATFHPIYARVFY